ncbi:hypothetical protein Tco_1178546 [Tanacetum coccineum]
MHKMWFLLHLTISAETQSFMLMFLVSTDFGLGEIHLVRWADGSERRFTSLRDLLPYVGRSDLVILYGLVMTKYADSPASGLGLDL